MHPSNDDVLNANPYWTNPLSWINLTVIGCQQCFFLQTTISFYSYSIDSIGHTNKLSFFSAQIVARKCSFNAFSFWFKPEFDSTLETVLEEESWRSVERARHSWKRRTHDLSIEYSQVFAIQIACGITCFFSLVFYSASFECVSIRLA